MIKGIIFDFNRTLYNPDLEQLTEGTIPLLEQLSTKGYPLCLLSKKGTEARREQISQLGLDKYFVDIQVSESDKTEEQFHYCAKIMSLPPEEIAVVGDRIKREIYLGNKCNMTTIWYKSGKFATETPQNTAENPHYTITKLKDLVQYLR